MQMADESDRVATRAFEELMKAGLLKEKSIMADMIALSTKLDGEGEGPANKLAWFVYVVGKVCIFEREAKA
jgi:hypothetical protein